RAASRTGSWQRASLFASAAWVGGFRAADRLCQRRQSLVIASRGAPARNCRADGIGRKPMAHRSSIIDGERAAFALRWSVGHVHLPAQREVDSHLGNEELPTALRISRLDLNSTLKGTSRGAAGTSAIWGRGNNVRRLLVVSELALSVVLLIGAGLLIRSFARLQDVPPGFDPRDVLTFDLTMTGRKYNDKQTTLNTYRQLWERMEHLPGANAAGGVTSLPLSQAFAWTPITVEGRTPGSK